MKTTRGISSLGVLFGFVLICIAGSAKAVPIGYNISWTEPGGCTMTGTFSYDDSLLNTGAIDETQIDNLMI